MAVISQEETKLERIIRSAIKKPRPVFFDERHSAVSKSKGIIALDQFTSQPEVWDRLKRIMAGYSALDIIVPEAYVVQGRDKDALIAQAQQNMVSFLERGYFRYLQHTPGFIIREQTTRYGTRYGLEMMVNLKAYSPFLEKNGIPHLLRPTEKTIPKRAKARAQLHRDAPLFPSHVLTALDDPLDMVIGDILKDGDLAQIYEYELEPKGGMTRGYIITDPETEDRVYHNLAELTRNMMETYELGFDEAFTMLVADGNHTLAALQEAGHRYALVQAVNLHKIHFGPINRLVEKAPRQMIGDMVRYFNSTGAKASYRKFDSKVGMRTFLSHGNSHEQRIATYSGDVGAYGVIQILEPKHILSVGSFEDFMKQYQHEVKVDYIHGTASLEKLSKRQNSRAFEFNAMKPEELTPTVMRYGVTPAKTFSVDPKMNYISIMLADNRYEKYIKE